MIRKATVSDCQFLAKSLWSTWRGLKARQIACPLDGYPSFGLLVDEITRDLQRWFVCESPDGKETGFFAVSEIGEVKTYRLWKFPKQSVLIQHLALLQSGELLLPQFQKLAAHLTQKSILVINHTSLREAYWAALKAGFKLLGESPTIVGTSAWLYLDRHASFEQIQTKLRRARILVAEPDSSAKSRRPRQRKNVAKK